MNEFDDIRPYDDSEISAVVARLAADRELADIILRYSKPRLPKLFYPLLRPLVARKIKQLFAGVEDVAAYQKVMAIFLDNVLQKSADGVTYSGLDQLDFSGGMLFLSNHRDIAMDPAMVARGLVEQGQTPMLIAIGDNLLQRPYASDLMRANRSFLVKRAPGGRREKMAALNQLSRFIRVQRLEHSENVWIAQREGRAKDSNDFTDTALLKMLALSRASKEIGVAEAVLQLRIVPVAVSYEYDPCDLDKARELYQRSVHGKYDKQPGEDLRSIYKGISGFKGRIHIAFGEVLPTALADDDAIAAEVDRQIHTRYRLFPSNLLAFERQGGDISAFHTRFELEEWQRKRSEFDQRFALVPVAHRDFWLNSYANPVRNYLAATAVAGVDAAQ